MEDPVVRWLVAVLLSGLAAILFAVFVITTEPFTLIAALVIAALAHAFVPKSTQVDQRQRRRQKMNMKV